MTDRPAPGTPLVFRWRKWDGSPHWEHDCVFLGSDAHGDWVGQRDGWRSARPGLDTVSNGDNVTLIKDLKVKGTSVTLKRGTLVKGIRLTNNPLHIEGKVNGVQIVLVAAYLKKA